MKLTIATVGEVVFSGDAYSVRCPGSAGEFTVLSHHAPLVSSLKEGVIAVRKERGENEEYFEARGGIVEVARNEVTILL